MEPNARLDFDARITLPNHALFVGGTQSGKTRLCLKLLSEPHLFHPRPQRIVFHYDQFQESYVETKAQLAKQGVELLLYKGCSDVNLDSFEKLSGQTILLIDDFSEETSSSKAIARIATNGRHKNLSLWLVWHSLFNGHSASRMIVQNVRFAFYLPSVRLESQLRTFGYQLGMKDALVSAYKVCIADDDESGNEGYRYLLVDMGPTTPVIMRLRSRIHMPIQWCFT